MSPADGRSVAGASAYVTLLQLGEAVGKYERCRADLARRDYALPTPTHDPAAARCYAKRYQDVERKLCPRGRYQPSCAEKMRGHYVAHGAEEGRVYGCSGERDSFKPTA